MKKNLYLVFFFVFCFLISLSTSAASYYGGEITLKYGEQKTVNLGEALKEAMNSFGAGYPYSWQSSSSSIVRTTMPQRTSCTLYACGIGTTTLKYHGEYYRNGTISDIDCTWDVTVEYSSNNTGDNNGGSGNNTSEPTMESWLTYGNYSIAWYNKSQTEFSISTPSQLAGLAYLVNNGANFEGKTIKIANDLDMNGNVWIGIGCFSSGAMFNGHFDGQGHTIRGLNIGVRKGDDYAGFFGSVDYKAEIHDLTVEGVLDAKRTCDFMGGFVGYSYGCEYTNINCNIPIYIENNLSQYASGFEINLRLGGFAGRSSSDQYSKVKYNGEISLNQSTSAAYHTMTLMVGGFIGNASDLKKKVEYCECKCSRIYLVTPDWNRSNSSASAPRIYVGGFSGGHYLTNEIKYTSTVCDEIILASYGFPFETPHAYVGAFAGYLHNNSASLKLTNCMGILKRLKNPTSAYLHYEYSDNCSSSNATFFNSDVSISGKLTNQGYNMSYVRSYLAEEMKTPGFLEELNMYSILNLDGPIWEMGDDGFPQLRELHLTDGISTPQIEEQLDKDGIYSLTGVKQQYLHKGLNIVRGKKMIVK